MRRDVFVYISGPMTANDRKSIEEHTAAGVKVYFELLKLGIPCFSPHLSGAFPTAWTVMPHAEWIEYDRAVIDRCTHVLMIEGWERSKGACLEKAYAEMKAIPTVEGMQNLLKVIGHGQGH